MGKAGKSAPKTVRATERREEAIGHRRDGLTYEKIGDKMGISAPRAWLLVKEALEYRRKVIGEAAEEIVAIELERCDAMIEGLTPDATNGDTQAVAALLKVQERRSKYQGLDAPTKLEATGDVVLSITPPVFDCEDGDAGSDDEKPETD